MGRLQNKEGIEMKQRVKKEFRFSDYIKDPLGQVENMIKECESISRNKGLKNLSSSQIRSIFTEIRRIYDDWRSESDGTNNLATESSIRLSNNKLKVKLLIPKLKYRLSKVGSLEERDKQTNKYKRTELGIFYDQLHECISIIETSSDMQRLLEIFETLVAFLPQKPRQ